MELKEYQNAALDAFGRWIDELGKARVQSETVANAIRDAGMDVPAEITDYPKAAWNTLAQASGVAGVREPIRRRRATDSACLLQSPHRRGLLGYV